MSTMNEQAVLALQSDGEMERFIGAQQSFILREAGKFSGRYVTRSDDEWSIALGAFYEALRKFNPSAGAFAAFADLLIGRRLTDYFRRERRYDPEVSIAPQAFDGAVDDDAADASLQKEVARKAVLAQPMSAAEEIETANALFLQYGFSFYDLAAVSPKTEKTRQGCARVCAMLLHTPLLLSEMKHSRTLPIKAAEKQSGVPRKLIERHRRYIIAAVLLLEGDYPILTEYLGTIRKEMAMCEA